MYKPKLTYVFCLMRKRSLMPAISVMRYMNFVGLIPQLLINGTEFGKNQHQLITKELNRYKIKYNEIKKPSNYDVMFSEGTGFFCLFEKYWLKESKKRGKSNVVLSNSLSGWRNDVNPYFLPENTKLIDGICMKIEEHLLYYKEFTKGLFLVNVGDPDWDWWSTNEFKEKVKKVKSELGNKILVLCEAFILSKDDTPYTEFCIKQAENLGFKVVINVHPDRQQFAPKQFLRYCNTTVYHHVLFKAASHTIGNIGSSTTVENLFLGTKVGCNPIVAHCAGHGEHRWLGRKTWITKVSKHFKSEILSMISPIFDEKELHSFLSSSKLEVSVQSTEKVFGKINVSCYAEYLFKTLDKKLMRKGKL